MGRAGEVLSYVCKTRERGVKLLLTTGLIPAGLLAFTLNAILPKK